MHESEQLFQQIAKHIPDVIYRYRVTPPRGFEYISPAVTAITGYTPEEHYADPDLGFKLIHPDDRARLEAVARGETAPGAPLDFRWIRKDDAIVWTEQRNVPIYDSAGKLVAIEGIARDITERKQAEDVLRESEQVQRLVLENVDEVVYLIEFEGANTLSGRIRFVSSRVEQILGHRPEEFQRDPELWLRLVHPDDVPALIERTGAILSSRAPDVRQYRIRHKHTGEYRWMEDRVVPQLNAAGEVVGQFGVARDITVRVQAEAALRESEERYRLLVELSPMAIFVHSHGALLFANAGGATLLGAAHPDELMGKSLLDFIHPDHHRELAMRAEQIEQAGKPRQQEETQFVAADGRTLYAEVSSAPITYRGQAARLAIVRDISKLRQAENALAERSRLLEAFFANTLISIVLLDHDFNFIRVNEAYATAGARDVSDFPGHNHFEFYPSEAQAIFEDVVKTKKPFQIFARPFVFPDHPDWGATYWDWTLVPILDNAGEVEFLVFTLNDVSERVRAEAERRKLASAVEQTADLVFITDRDGVIQYVNAAFETSTGYTKEEVLGKTPRIVKSGKHHDEFYEKLWQTILAGEVFHAEIINQKKNGELYFEEKTIAPIRDAQGNITHFVSTGRDVTERKRAEEERALLFDQVRASRERLRQLAQQVVFAQEEERHRISHELHDEAGQALTALRINLELAQGDLPANLTAIRQHLSDCIRLIETTSERIHLLAQNLRPPGLDAVGLGVTLDGFCLDFARRTQLSIDYVGTDVPALPEMVTISLYRFLQEALTNVARHAHAEHVKVVLNVDADAIGLSVEDDGQGFDVQSAQAVSVRPKSIGLIGMQERFGSLGGRVEIVSQPGQGTRLIARIPRKELA